MNCKLEDGNICIECCKWMTFIIDIKLSEVNRMLEFYKARGCQVKTLNRDSETHQTIAFTVPSPCPNLTITGCAIHENKPELCEQYDCRQDLFLKGGKYNGKKT